MDSNSNEFAMFPSKNENPSILSYHISPDVTIEYLDQKTNEPPPSISDDEETDYFNPLTYCSIIIDEDVDTTSESTDQKSLDFTQKSIKATKNNENSSFVCNSTDSGPTKKKRFSCHLCDKTFGWTTDLKRHILFHTGERPFKCTMCFATFTRNFLLQKHKAKIHQCLSPNEVSQLNNNVAKNLMEIKLKMKELEEAKCVEQTVLENKTKAKKKSVDL